MNDLISLFETDVVAEYRKYFPNSYIKFSKGSLGSTFITLMLTSPNDCMNKISQNDQFYTTIMLSDGYTIEHNQGSLSINPLEKYLAMSSIKCQLRKTTGDKDKIVKALSKYFAKRKQLVVDNMDNIYHVSDIDKKYLV